MSVLRRLSRLLGAQGARLSPGYRPATASDLPTLVDIMLVQYQKGVFGPPVDGATGRPLPMNSRDLRALVDWQLRACVEHALFPMSAEPDGGEVRGSACRTLVLHLSGQPVGFTVVSEHAEQSWTTDVDLRLFALHASHQGGGLGSLFLDTVLATLPASILRAACRPRAARMKEMLLRRGFTEVARLPTGTTQLRLDRAAVRVNEGDRLSI